MSCKLPRCYIEEWILYTLCLKPSGDQDKVCICLEDLYLMFIDKVKAEWSNATDKRQQGLV